MNSNLKQALEWLSIADEDTAALFLEYGHFAGYLDTDLLDKAVAYLHKEKPFLGYESEEPGAIVARILGHGTRLDPDGKTFLVEDMDTFLADLSPIDILDLLVFIQQTAFDRGFKQERNELSAKAWMAVPENCSKFMTLQQRLHLVDEQLPQKDAYYAVGIMGASYPRAEKRMMYFKTLAPSLSFDSIYAITGQRYLSKGLDTEAGIAHTASLLGMPSIPAYTVENNQYLIKDISETQMVRSLIPAICPEYASKIQTIDSRAGAWHWRADTAQNAKDFAEEIIAKITAGEAAPSDGIYHILLIVEQPYANRMAKQVQRALDELAEDYNTKHGDKIRFIVESSGKGIPPLDSLSLTDSIKYVMQSNSDFAAWIGECYKDGRLAIEKMSSCALRKPECLMFNTREKYHESLCHRSSPLLSAAATGSSEAYFGRVSSGPSTLFAFNDRKEEEVATAASPALPASSVPRVY